jgi:hypothetical protein
MWQVARMDRIGRCAVVLAAASLAVAVTPASAQETYELSGDAAVWNLAGVVTITGGGSSLAVEVVRGGADGGQLEVATGSVDLDQDGVERVDALRVLYPGDEIAYEGGGGAELLVRDDGTFYRGHERGRKVKIRQDGGGLDAHADLDIQVPDGRTLRVYLAAGEVVVTNVDGDLTISSGSADIQSLATSGPLVLDTGSGDVMVDGATGDVTVDTGSGDVGIRGVSGGELTVDTGSGDVTGGSITVGELNVDTGSGDVRFDGVEASSVTTDTGSGDVEVVFLASPTEVSVDTGSGDVTLTFPASWQSQVELDTSSGDIHSDFQMTVEEMDDDYVRGRIGSGGGSLEVDTGSGDIRLNQG